MSRSSYLLILNSAILTVCAVFIGVERSLILIGLLFFLPFLDKNHTLLNLSINRVKLSLWITLSLTGIGLISLNPEYANKAFSTLIFAALPEEWFFRGYLLTQLKNAIKYKNRYPELLANISTSALFALLHTPTQGWFGLTTFFPSLFYGWIYQKTNDLLLVILLHALSNIVFFIYFIKH